MHERRSPSTFADQSAVPSFPSLGLSVLFRTSLLKLSERRLKLPDPTRARRSISHASGCRISSDAYPGMRLNSPRLTLPSLPTKASKMGAERGLIRALTLSVVFVTLITNSRTMAALSLVTDRLDLKHCAAALLVYTLVKYIYRGFFSPVARQHIPGPPLARFTHLWTTLHFLGFRRIFAVEEAHRKYGPVVRIAPNYISINRP